MIRRFLLVFVALLGTSIVSPSAAQSLSQAEYDLLKVRFAEQLKTEQFAPALQSIAQIKTSGYQYPKSVIYYEGLALMKLERLAEAEATFRQYIEDAGSSGSQYTKSLQNIVRIEGLYLPLMEEYGALIETPKPDEARLDELERALGNRVAPLKAQREEALRLAAEAAVEAEHKAAEERAVLEAKYAEQAKLTWEKTFTTPGGKEQSFASVAVLENGEIFAVGLSKNPECFTPDNVWLTPSNAWMIKVSAAGEELHSVTTCFARKGYQSDEFFSDIDVSPDQKLYVAGSTQHKGNPALAVHFIDPDLSTTGYNYLSNKKAFTFARQMAVTPLENGNFASGGVITHRYFGEKRREHQNVAFLGVVDAATGNSVWNSLSYKSWHHIDRTILDIAELKGGQIFACGVHGYVSGLSYREFPYFAVFDPSGKPLSTPQGNQKHDGIVLKDKGQFTAAVATDDGGALAVGSIKKSAAIRKFSPNNPEAGRFLKSEWSVLLDEATVLTDILAVDGGYVVVGAAKQRGGSAGWIGKIDHNGTLLWSRTYGGKGKNTFSGIAAIPHSDGFVVAGRKGKLGWVLKLNAEGQL